MTVDQDHLSTLLLTPMNVIIPACADEATVAYGFNIIGGCDAIGLWLSWLLNHCTIVSGPVGIILGLSIL